MKIKLSCVAAALLAVTLYSTTAFAQDCPICPGGTNGPGGGAYTNPPSPPQEYALDTLLVRVERIMTPGWVTVYTNYGWTIDTNNLLISAGASTFDNDTANQWQTLVYTLAVTNTLPTRVYTVQFTTNLLGTWVDLGDIFIGTTNGSEFVVESPMPNIGIPIFWRAKQQDGFVAWAHAATNGFNGGTGSGCPGTYHGYINWTFPLPTWGYTPNTNVLDHWATDLREPTNHLEVVTDYGYVDCNTNTVKWTNIPSLTPPLYGTRARFSVFYKTYPTNQAYPLWFRGYLQPTNDINPHIVGLPSTGFTVQPWAEMDSTQMKAMGLTTNDLMTGHPAD